MDRQRETHALAAATATFPRIPRKLSFPSPAFSGIVLVGALALAGCSDDEPSRLLHPDTSQPAYRIQLTPEVLEVEDGRAGALEVTFVDEDGTVSTSGPDNTTLRWSVSDPEVAEVSAPGAVRALHPGEAEVEVRVASAHGSEEGLTGRAALIVRQVGEALQPESGEAQEAGVGSTLPEPVEVRLVDRHGDPVPGVQVRFSPTHGEALPSEAETDAEGVAGTSWTLGMAAGEQLLEIDSGEHDVESILVTAQARSLDPSALIVVRGDRQSAQAGQRLPQALAVDVTDAHGNAAPNAEVRWSVTSGGGELSRTTGLTNARGRATSQWTLGSASGAQRVTATVDRGASARFTATAEAASPPSDDEGPRDTGGTNECDTPGAGWIWCDDFEQNRLGQYFEHDDSGGGFVRARGVGMDGSHGMRASFDRGQVSAGSLKLAFGRTPQSAFGAVDGGSADYREIYWRVYVRYDPSWTGGGGDKMSRVTSFTSSSSWAQSMIGHIWSGSGSTRDLLVADPASGTNGSGNVRTTTYNDFDNLSWLGGVTGNTPMFSSSSVGKWYCVEARVRLNSAGSSNGIFEMWVDDRLEARATGLDWVGSFDDYGMNAVFLENYWNEGSPQAQSRYFDRFVVSTQRIGC